jgi:hypothetical protein
MGITFLGNEDRLIGIALLTFGSIALFVWMLKEGLNWDATLLTLIMPPLFTLGVGLFWFLLPSTFYARLPVIALYGIGIYSIALTANVLSVSVLKKIALARAAKGVSFVLTLFTLFLLYDAVLSIKTSVVVSSLVIYLSSFFMFVQGLWVSRITKYVGREVALYSAIFSYIVSGIWFLLFFWPVTVVVGSLFLTVTVYMLLGLGQARIEGRLFRTTVNEYLIVGVAVFLVMMLTTSWHG